ncbi:MAG: universal stress protein [Sandaracinaceae bacterium]
MTATVLCATDLSAEGHLPVELASDVARRLGAELQLLHVGDDPRAHLPDPIPNEIRPAVEQLEQRLEARRQKHEQELQRMCELAGSRGVPCTTSIAEGRAWEVIVDAAERTPAPDLVVVGAHGSGRNLALARLGSRILGSTADRVVRHAQRPVLVAPVERPSPVLGDGPVVVGIDPSEISVRAAAVAAELADRVERRLIAVHVLPRTSDRVEAFAMLDDHAERRAAERFASLEKALPGRVTLRLVTAFEGPAEALVESASSVDACVLAVGTHARQGPSRWILGSTAERVLRLAKMPVLIVPPGARALSPR